MPPFYKAVKRRVVTFVNLAVFLLPPVCCQLEVRGPTASSWKAVAGPLSTVHGGATALLTQKRKTKESESNVDGNLNLKAFDQLTFTGADGGSH